MTEWEKAQAWELNWHDNCINSLYEEEKQIVYAEKMGLIRTPNSKTPYVFDLKGASVLDIGGGAYSLLLKCINFHDMTFVTDPLMDKYPEWVKKRYESVGISTLNYKGEDVIKYGFYSCKDKETKKLEPFVFDMCLIYNVLEHCEDPKKVIENALNMSKEVRIFEWINTSLGVNNGHIHSFTEQQLNEYLGGEGKTEMIKRGGAMGKGYWGIFRGKHYGISNR